MALILSIETSTKVCSVAFHQDGVLLSSSEIFIEKSHSKMITVLVEQLLKELKKNFSDIDAIAVSKGPGSYTGLRIGVSTAKGLCYALDKPLIGVNTLLSMAFGVKENLSGDYLFCPMIDARRMEVYCALYDKDLNVVEDTQAKIIDENFFIQYFDKKKIFFFGDGAAKCISSFEKQSNATFIESIYPSAKNIGYLAYDLWNKKQWEDVAYFEPFYLKDFVTKNT
ncbi:MAG: tRNA (adenosine(37)-N6)-threonylcarbamoyltransferase complex dimerization subunit type 1 TsaB [Cytophagaceae bacterium]|nr:tRNA (adenosine(37)-N6)-threonylcarbamoyltransferase complex dimerization subunit type 1 TsaB [Cytophagaceae bacterium]